MIWAYGVTTVPTRRESHLPRTLESLRAGGFDSPRLFVDGAYDYRQYSHFHLPLTLRQPAVKTAWNWVLAMLELLGRHPESERFALFQDDLVCVKNLRQYLDKCGYPTKGYLNLYTFSPPNEQVIQDRSVGWYEASLQRGQPEGGEQRGLSALGLVFSREALITLLSSRRLVERPDTKEPFPWWKKIDGGIVTSMNRAGYREYVHNPSLLQHTGYISAMGNFPHPPAQSFPGEDSDALQLLEER